MEVVELHPKHPCEDLIQGLRNIADDIEAGEYDFDPNIAIVVLARESQSRDSHGFNQSYNWQTHALGERATYFTVKGLMGSALTSFDGESEE